MPKSLPIEQISDELLEMIYRSGQLPEYRYYQEKRRREPKHN